MSVPLYQSGGGGAGSGLSGLTAGKVPRATSPTTIASGSITDDGAGTVAVNTSGGALNLIPAGDGSASLYTNDANSGELHFAASTGEVSLVQGVGIQIVTLRNGSFDLGSAGAGSLTLKLFGSSTGTVTFTAPATAGSPTLTTPTGSGVLAVVAAASGQPAYSDLSGSPASGTVLWNALGNAAGSLTLANGSNATTFNQTSSAIWGWANTTPMVGVSLALTQVAVAGGNSTYTGTITGGGSNALVGAVVTFSGFANSGNNVTNAVVTVSTTTTLVVSTSTQVNETHAGAVISGAVVNSPVIKFLTQYGANATDSWTIQQVMGSVVANPTSQLQFVHAGSTGQASVLFPSSAVNVTTPSVLWNGGTAGYGIGGTAANALIAYVPTAAGATVLNIVQNGASRWAITAGDNSAANQSLAIAPQTANYGQLYRHSLTTSTSLPGFLFGSNGGNNGNMAATSGTAQIHASFEPSFVPASGASPFVAVRVQPTVNQTSTSSGSYTALQVNAIETSLKGSANLLLDLQAGTTGGTSKFAVDNSGKITVPSTNTATSASTGANGAVPAQVVGYLIVNIAGTNQKIPYFAT